MTARVRFARLVNYSSRLHKIGSISPRTFLAPGNHSAFCFLTSRFLSSSKPSREVQAHEPQSKIVDLAGKPIPSKRVPTISPSNHVKLFELALQKGKSLENFIEALDNFKKSNRPRRGHMELLKVSMEFMDKFEVEKEVEAYNAMLDVFPRGRFENKTIFDAIWAKNHPQVALALKILTKLEENLIIPSIETYDLCEEIFGRASQPVQKTRRIAYWLRKLQQMYPHPLPKNLPEKEAELSQLAIARMAKNAIPIRTYQNETKEGRTNFIVSSQTKEQRTILENYDTDIPVYVEGPFLFWIRRLQRHYFVLKVHGSVDVSDPLIDDEGTVVAVCMIGSHNIQDNLRQWIGKLEEQVPKLAKMKVIFNLNHDELNKIETSC